MRSKAQATVEYIILIAFLLSVAIPAGYFLMNLTNDVNEEYEFNQLGSYADSIIKQSEVIYYNGLFSKMTLTPSLDMNTYSLTDVYVIEIDDGTNKNYILMLTIDTASEGGPVKKNLTYWSEVPLMTNYTCKEDGNLGEVITDCATIPFCRVCRYNSTRFANDPIQIESVLNDSVIKIKLSEPT